MGFFDNIYKFFSTDCGIDLGTCNTLVCVRGEGIVINEPSVVAIKKQTKEVITIGGQFAVGNLAKAMIGKTPEELIAIRPLKNGVISDFDITQAMIRYFIEKAQNNRNIFAKPLVIISVPTGLTNVEKQAVISSGLKAGARHVFLIPQPRACGLGLNLPINEPKGHIICDVGGGTTQVAVLSMGEVVTWKTIRIAGDEMDEAIIKFMKSKYQLQIGPQTAEYVKINAGSATPLEQEIEIPVKGLDTQNNIPKKIIIRSEEIREALSYVVKDIMKVIKDVLAITPPELAADLVETGLVLCGGGSLLRNLDKAIEEEIQIPVKIAQEPLYAAVKGTGVVLENLHLLKDTLESDITL
ncbi:MAG: rod shape-determining protein [Planctomycetota bacterium]